MKYISLLLLFLTFNLYAQICAPNYRYVDKQIVLPNNFVVLLWTDFWGDMMDMYEKDKKFGFYSTIISPQGHVYADNLIYLDWPEMHYNYEDCICSYNPAYEIDKQFTETNSKENYHTIESLYLNAVYCPTYHLYLNGNDLIVNLSLRGDRRNTYEISLNFEGEVNWKRHNIDTLSLQHNLSKPSTIKTEEDKAEFFKTFLSSKYNQLVPVAQTQLLVDSLTNTYIVKDKNLQITPLSEDLYTPTKIKGDDWETFLNGSLFRSYKNIPPLVNLMGKTLFVTIYNDDILTCPYGYGSDTYPIIYCIDTETGRKWWQTRITYGALKEIDER